MCALSAKLLNLHPDRCQILDRGLLENTKIEDERLFRRRAHRLLNILTDFLKLFPEELAVHGVELLSDRPVKYGGFADIYHGKYINTDGEEVEAALKVLKIFQDQSDDGRRLLLQKFAKETLVWRYLKHPNIVPFLGVDATTFPAPTMAMVSLWMSQGNALNYMAENSPVARYAITLLDDIIQGLMYLHTENIVHGDLCGRNILIDKERARLVDFGLAAFVELESIQSSTRKGSTRWMAPELLLPDVYHPGRRFRQTPASDVWAFGCVCCEIWTEGQIPFVDMSDGGIIVALSRADGNAVPYKTKPCDKAGIPMPERLWELVKWCFKLDGAERPAVKVIAHILFEMKQQNWSSSDLAAGGSITALPIQPRSSGSTPSALPEEVHPQLVVDGKQERVHFAEEYAIVRFGPLRLDAASDLEELFQNIFAGLLKLLRRDVLVAPLGIDRRDSQYLDLRFRSPAEANNFTMTWMVCRYDPYKEVSAVLVDN
ncbi:kinase-like domain-containing protein [Mycena alexandri]|uniref:Kinase-like domain-containing protein n=1 Tax=Mycena alexandri TaxID=1745969 RepID=A0AAD6WTK4_9AGAR|nr:kinase-like domain-containing protein [Mycena alexandri]